MSWSGFGQYGLSEDIVRALEGLGFNEPTEVQREVIPVVMHNRDIVVKSQTGSGKTAAYGIPLCELVNWEENKPQVLILTPTRELAVQVKEDLTNIGRFKRVRAAAIYGKQPFHVQKLELKQKTHIVAGTPGRVLDHIEKGTFPLGKLAYLVIDEADEMLNMGFIDQVEAIIQRLPAERVTMLFSATLPEDVDQLRQKYMRDPVSVEIQATGLTTDAIEHAQMKVSEADKFELLQNVTMVENPDSCIIFCRTQEGVNDLFRGLARLEYPCDRIHGGMAQEERLEVMSAFRRGQFRYLIATDVAARGIDIDNITHVINYDFPLDKEGYVHRTGRTGRAGKRGQAITFVTPSDEGRLAEVEKYIGFRIRRVEEPSAEEVESGRGAFEQKIYRQTRRKKDKGEQVSAEAGIMKLYFNGGKKKKLRAVDFVGTIARIDGMAADDIGIIAIQDNETFVDILNGKGLLVLQAMKSTTVKGKLLKVHKAK
ncbi:DEAD/DEAH box helicase [Paenibacillus sp. MMS18-CY102]|uniref:DEAD/DEAH box helicase n=1 Tax=Paenibacillus sp. MMS18-CY102 TaxID=2682849 RepID=UPI00136614A7|nr:DEAD/DEAH box helicase [Paenibacillus sp. MMS18-CY102]MWC29419.1 DEAD/DEAH box helicase [Paenibacillus sp. MMS18-CY102]